MIPRQWIEEAHNRIGDRILETPVTHDPKHDLYLKWENRQRSGSFKVRGAFNKVLSLADWERERGLVAASAGNHGAGLALAAQEVGANAIIYVSEKAVPSKVEAMRELGAEVRSVVGNYGEAEKAGLAYAARTGATWVSAYNDGQVIAGQATLGQEILRQVPESIQMTWIVPVGGGGLLAGIASAVHTSPPEDKGVKADGSNRVRLIGVQSEASPFFYALYHGQEQDDYTELPSLADGLAGKIEDGAITIPIVKRLADEMVLISEAEIARAVGYAWQHYGETIEGSAAAALAAALGGRVNDRPAIVIISGGNIEPDVHARLREDRNER